ncbi:N-acetylmuramoyl-L-alanine amidase [Ferrimonas balearica]|nr:N-acetylmuramoyl-L-alanine amidase [Ferrimonas balearica]
MATKNHRFEEFWYGTSSNLSRSVRIEPTLIVMHYTTGWSGAGARDWLMGRAGGTDNTGTSAHLVVDRDGTTWQIAPFNRRAWHAGPSQHGGLSGLNSHAIGIEILNPGYLKPLGPDLWVDGYGHRRTTAELEDYGGFLTAPHARIGPGSFAWPLYTPEQLTVLRQITSALIDSYAITDIVSHEEIDTRGWKTDPGPAFPLETFRDLLGQADEGEEEAVWETTASRLNFRGEGRIGAELVDPPGQLLRGTRVKVLSRVPDWAFVEVLAVPEGAEAGGALGVTGWISTRYMLRIA